MPYAGPTGSSPAACGESQRKEGKCGGGMPLFAYILTHGEKYVKVRKVAYCNMFMRGNNYKLIIN